MISLDVLDELDRLHARVAKALASEDTDSDSTLERLYAVRRWADALKEAWPEIAAELRSARTQIHTNHSQNEPY